LRRGRFIILARTMFERSRVHGVSFSDQAQRFIAPILPAFIRAFLLRQRDRIVRRDWMNSDRLAFVRAESSAPLPELTGELNGLPPVRDIGSLCVALTFGANLQNLLHWEDRNSMAHSIEARVPFLDHRVVEFTIALGNDHKIVRSDTKRVLREAMRGIIPAEVCERRDKLGFTTPEQVWFSALKPTVLDAVESTLRRFPGLLNAAGTRQLAAGMVEGRRPVSFDLWRIINLGIWGEKFGVSL
jgi:asparagine synthase (glutamine-hydrolysing)